MRATYCALDLETTGLNPNTCQVLELGAVAETDWSSPVDDLPRLRLLVDHGDTLRGEYAGIAMNAALIAEIAEARRYGGLPPARGKLVKPYEIVPALTVFLARNLGGGPWWFGGKNFGGFDARFLRRLPGWGDVRHRHRYYDPAGLWFDPATDDGPPDLTTCLHRAGLPADGLHTAVGDARSVVRLIRAGFARTAPVEAGTPHHANPARLFGDPPASNLPG